MASLLAFVGLAHAAPLPASDNASSSLFFIRSADGKYVTAFHSGAAENWAVLTDWKNNYDVAYWNGTTIESKLGSAYIWGAVVGPKDNTGYGMCLVALGSIFVDNMYFTGFPLYIPVGYGSSGFTFEDGKLSYEGQSTWLGTVDSRLVVPRY